MENFVPNVSVDCVIFGFNDNMLKVLLTKRELKDPATQKLIFSDFTLQGHHVMDDESLDDAAKRVLKEKTGLENIYLEQFKAFGDIDRLLNERDQLWLSMKFPMVPKHVFTIAYYSLVDSSKVNPDKQHRESMWFPVNELPELGYDHKIIIESALNCLRIKLAREPIGFELLPEKFTLSQLQNLYEAIFGTTFDRRNFRKKVSQMKYVIPLNERQKGVSHIPGKVFIFSSDVYKRTKSEKMIFSI